MSLESPGSVGAVTVPVVFALIFLLGTVGNGLVLAVLLQPGLSAWQEPGSSTDLFILNLAVADLCFILCCVPFQATIYTLDAWLFGALVCKAVHLLIYLTMYASSFTLAAVSVDRCAVPWGWARGGRHRQVVTGLRKQRRRDRRRERVCEGGTLRPLKPGSGHLRGMLGRGALLPSLPSPPLDVSRRCLCVSGISTGPGTRQVFHKGTFWNATIRCFIPSALGCIHTSLRGSNPTASSAYEFGQASHFSLSFL